MEILEPAIKEVLWHKMRADLSKFFPRLINTDLLMCCVCGRFLDYDSFSLEHIIPRQALADDPVEVKQTVTANQRSGNLLLCNVPVMPKGGKKHSGGCNGWKGTYFDRCLKQIFDRSALPRGEKPFTSRHHVAFVSMCYLAMVREYGYQIALTPSGSLLRRQFLSPNDFLSDSPVEYQFFLAGERPSYTEDAIEIWKKPFRFDFDDGRCTVIMKNIAQYVPISRDPRVPIAQHLIIKPAKYAIRPIFESFIE